ncbi:Gibberellin 3-beta-dioxygenase 1 [Panicum miliaceum]|uniref:Gibberellin 3-beta-dioxygenase 1 n=1 Tax=Panicum miliaceum TaxID=4540 RepID=A0A3L6PPK5_PANMI|nr:Gibberellin 3-beta-dioxygenase 1 [Panicum miliaceum]
MLGLHRKLEAMIWRAWASATERRLPPRLAQLQPPAVALRGVEAPPATACSWRRTGTIHRAVRGRAARRRGPRGAGQGRRELARGGPQAGHRVTVAVIAGELLAVVTRVLACLHRVSAPGGRERLSAQFVSKPKDSHTVRPLDELVDGDHPPLYKPCDFDGYVRFRFAGDGRKLSDPLEAFGVAKDE